MSKQIKVNWGIFSKTFTNKLEAFDFARERVEKGESMVATVVREQWVQVTPVSGHVISTELFNTHKDA